MKKRLIAGLLILIFITAIMGCSNSDNDDITAFSLLLLGATGILKVVEMNLLNLAKGQPMNQMTRCSLI